MMDTSSSPAPDVRSLDTLPPIRDARSLGAPPPAPKADGASLLCRPAEELFKKGLTALKQDETIVARALFEGAIQLERESGKGRVQPRFLSYFGVTLMERPETLSKARDYCLHAVREEFFNPDLFLNLSRVYLKLGVRGEAYRTAARGLALDPRHSGLKRQLAELGIRRPPPLRFLGRSSSLNVLLGRMFRRNLPARS